MAHALDWLLEEDSRNPAVRYRALTELLERPSDDPEVIAARTAAMESGAIPAILAAQHRDGYWEKPGPGYYPKYRGTVWSVIYLSQLGADPADSRIRAACEVLLSHAIAPNGGFSMTGTLSGNIQCLSGNLGAALQDLGMGGSEVLQLALERMAQYATGEGIAPVGEKKAPLRYLKSGACGPTFCCSANNRLPCAWGAVKVLRALSRIPKADRSQVIEHALTATADFLFSVDPATAAYPCGYSDKPSRSWFKFGFPVFYVSDVLQIAEALTEAGFGGDPRLAATYELILGKQDHLGRCRMEYSYEGKTWFDVEERGKPSKWVTLRAMKVLKGRDGAQ
ncbi:nitrogen fixation protein NifH [Chloroflexota bacterium]